MSIDLATAYERKLNLPTALGRLTPLKKFGKIIIEKKEEHHGAS